MTIYIQGLSALAHYRSSDATTEPERCPRSIAALDSAVSSRAACTAARVWRMGIDEPTVDCPLEVLVRDKSQRSRSKAVIARVWGKPIARTAFRRASKDVYVSSPEFVFLQLATRLDLPELVALGMELCGTYRRNVKVPVLGTNDTELITLYQQKPLTNPKRLGSFIKSMPSTPGHARAMKALGYVLANSASPMETALYLLLCLPRRFGGYALPKPVLNPPITLSKAGRMYTLRSVAKPDLYWKDFHLDLEYNSDEFHDESSRAVDSMRRKALERMGVEVIELTKEELLSTRFLHATAQRIARRMKKQLRPQSEGSFEGRRASLRDLLLARDDSQDSASSCSRDEEQLHPDGYDFCSDDMYMSDVPEGAPVFDDADMIDMPSDMGELADTWWADASPEITDTPYDEDLSWSDDELYVYGGRSGKENRPKVEE